MFIPPPAPLPVAPSNALPPPPILLAELIDTKTGDARSFLAGDDPLDAAIQWQFTVRQGSGAALGTNGHRLHTITKATPQAPAQLADEARRVVGKFIERGQLGDVEVEGAIVGDATATGAVQIQATNVPAARATRVVQIGGA